MRAGTRTSAHAHDAARIDGDGFRCGYADARPTCTRAVNARRGAATRDVVHGGKACRTATLRSRTACRVRPRIAWCAQA
ncbi:hypothetical protein VL15_18965 [Burkholderia cepacia]|uniref:Uncharacterized protein n=1 Tax=Burkholderia cepacia TaxID=292 RepID=A0A0J5WLD3_BURCE|nr:hypothetical protein VL15_18965 [Burkholderia cepacia]